MKVKVKDVMLMTPGSNNTCIIKILIHIYKYINIIYIYIYIYIYIITDILCCDISTAYIYLKKNEIKSLNFDKIYIFFWYDNMM